MAPSEFTSTGTALVPLNEAEVDELTVDITKDPLPLFSSTELAVSQTSKSPSLSTSNRATAELFEPTAAAIVWAS